MDAAQENTKESDSESESVFTAGKEGPKSGDWLMVREHPDV